MRESDSASDPTSVISHQRVYEEGSSPCSGGRPGRSDSCGTERPGRPPLQRGVAPTPSRTHSPSSAISHQSSVIRHLESGIPPIATLLSPADSPEIVREHRVSPSPRDSTRAENSHDRSPMPWRGDRPGGDGRGPSWRGHTRRACLGRSGRPPFQRQGSHRALDLAEGHEAGRPPPGLPGHGRLAPHHRRRLRLHRHREGLPRLPAGRGIQVGQAGPTAASSCATPASSCTRSARTAAPAAPGCRRSSASSPRVASAT